MDWSVKTPWHERIELARSGLWAPAINYIYKYPIIIWSEEIRGRGTKKKKGREVGVITIYF